MLVWYEHMLSPSLKGIKMESQIWGILAVLAGGLISIGTTVMVARNARLLQQEASSIERNERAKEFQRNNLLELQGFFVKQRNLTVRRLSNFQMIASKNKEDGLIRDNLFEEFLTVNQNILILTERIADQPLRNRVHFITSIMTAVDSEEAMETAIKLSGEVWGEAGVVLRSLY